MHIRHLPRLLGGQKRTQRFARSAAVRVFADVFERVTLDLRSVYGARAAFIPSEYHDRPYSHLLKMVPTHNDAPGCPGVFVKKLKPLRDANTTRARVIHEYVVTACVHDAMRKYDDLGAVRPLACYQDESTIVTEECEGHTLLRYLETFAAWTPTAESQSRLVSTMRQVGRWISALQLIEPSTERIAPDELVEYIDVRLARLVQESKGHFVEADRSDIRRHISSLAHKARDSDMSSVTIHADLSLGNLLVQGPKVVALDFAMSRRGAPLHDLARVHVQLAMLLAKRRFRKSLISILQSALLAGFSPSLSQHDPLFRLLSMLHRINNLASLYVRRPTPWTVIHSRRLRMTHERWIEAELARGVQGQ
jgi:aminoglycoside phosphotransferase (APT) family kinase protein